MGKNIDTKIRHVTAEDANIFAELGFDRGEAERLREKAGKEVEQLLAIKRQLMLEISTWIAENKLRQADAQTTALARAMCEKLLARSLNEQDDARLLDDLLEKAGAENGK